MYDRVLAQIRDDLVQMARVDIDRDGRGLELEQELFFRQAMGFPELVAEGLQPGDQLGALRVDLIAAGQLQDAADDLVDSRAVAADDLKQVAVVG